MKQTTRLWGLWAPVLGMGIWSLAGTGAIASANSCYATDSNGNVYDLSALCSVPSSQPAAEPVLQTGDIQVTLRWNTTDDLDLIVVDPSGAVVDFGSPTSPTGGRLDVDANGFCETQARSPVENIFWPPGSAPNGDYLAYVTLAIPCSLEALAEQDLNAASAAYASLEVPYSLTILVEGVTNTYEGTSRPEQFGAEYPFRVGPEGAAPSIPAPARVEQLELPEFGLPDL